MNTRARRGTRNSAGPAFPVTDPSRVRPEKREEAEQRALFDFLRLPHVRNVHPALCWVHASLNGAAMPSGVAGRMAATGMVKGVWDVCVPAGADGGVLYIEMKDPQQRPKTERGNPDTALSDEQRAFRDYVTSQGHRCVVCFDWLEAARAIFEHLSITEQSHPGAWDVLRLNEKGTPTPK